MIIDKIHLDLIGAGNQRTRPILEPDVLLRHRKIGIERIDIGKIKVGFSLCRKKSAPQGQLARHFA
jgi:hypothetical protein